MSFPRSWFFKLLFRAAFIALLWLPFVLLRLNVLSNLLIFGRYEVDLIAFWFMVGGLSSLVVMAGMIAQVWSARRTFRAVNHEQQRQAVAHRDFMRRLDHEMKNPLTTIRIGLLNIQQTVLSDPPASLTRVLEQTQRLQKLIEDLRYLTEVEEYKLDPVPVNMKEVIQSAIDFGSQDQQDRLIDLHVQQIPWPLPDAWGDPDLLLVVMRNLIDNALKYTRPQDRIAIRAVEDGPMALIEVADTGIGIPPESLSHVFEELYRGSNARGIVGSGLGLALVQRIVALHLGRIEINSRLDQGTILRLWLPLAGKRQD